MVSRIYLLMENYSNFSFAIFKFSMEIHSTQQVLISMTIFLWQHGGWMVATMKSESKIFWMKSESKILWEHKGWMVATIHQIWFVHFSVHSLISITLNLLLYEQDLHIFKLISMIFISNVVILGHPLSFKKHILDLLSCVWGSDSVAFVWTMSFVTILRSIQILIYKVINYTDGITVHILIFRRLKVVRYPYHSMDSVMDMRISLKASQYMMLSKTKVQGKTILDTRSWNK